MNYFGDYPIEILKGVAERMGGGRTKGKSTAISINMSMKNMK